jgi:hypothetical protein
MTFEEWQATSVREYDPWPLRYHLSRVPRGAIGYISYAIGRIVVMKDGTHMEAFGVGRRGDRASIERLTYDFYYTPVEVR